MSGKNNFEDIVRICLIPRLYDLLDYESNNLLYCSKKTTNLFINYCVKNHVIKSYVSKSISLLLRKHIRELFCR